MSELGTVVVGFDGSPSSHDALALGARLAQASDAELVAAFVYRADLVPLGDESEFDEWQRSIALRELGAAQTLQPSAEIVAVRARSVARGLHELAGARDAGVVVVGGTHRGAIGRVVPGSTAQRLLEGAPCPVAVAPRGWGAGEVAAGAAGASLAPVVAGFDGEEDSRVAVAWAGRVAALLGAPLRIVTVVEPLPPIPRDPVTFVRPDALEEALRGARESLRASLREDLDGLAASVASVASVASSDAAGTSGLSVDTEILDGHPADRLVAQADGDGGLIVVGSRGYGPLGAVLVGSVAAEVLREATSPVIVVPRSA